MHTLRRIFIQRSVKVYSIRALVIVLFIIVFLIVSHLNQSCSNNSDSFILLYNLSSIPSKDTVRFAISSKALGDTSMGRLGNQMFILASIYGIGRRLGAYGILGYSFSSELDIILKEFRIGEAVQKRVKLDGSGFSKMEINLPDEKCCVHMDFIDHLARIELKNIDLLIINGYLQSWKYFHQYKSEIINDIFQFRSSIVSEAKEQLQILLHEGVDKNAHFSCIHARRGDFQNEMFQKVGYRSTTYTTILSAIEYLNKTISGKDLRFLLFSDDPSWCVGHFGHRSNLVTVIGPQSPAVAMQMMREYCHSMFITASFSTFGWWAAYLSHNAQIFYNAVTAVPGSRMDKLINNEDRFLPEWTAVYLKDETMME